ncbi:MAG TPA: COX15/CtaA family protein [Ramlibacter sp.]|nr:COX15/CtaA family protein [Ramlibacter sp.]
MNAPLYDLSPALHIMLMGVVVASGPLAWMWLRSAGAVPARRLQALTVLVLFLTFDLVLFGAFTRLTDAGLGCPDWPGCYGQASPSAAHDSIERAQHAMPTGPVTHAKAWIEMVHRYLATGVGVLILTLAAGTWALRRRGAAVSPWWPTATLAWVCVQGALGAFTVTMKLFPAVVTMHLLAALVLLALLCRQAVSYQHAQERRGPVALAPDLRTLLLAVTALVWLQIALGGWVSTNYAVLACTDFPTCQGSWWPPMDLRHGFELWRDLGMTPGGQPIDFAALTAIHYVHRLMAYAVLVLLAILAVRLGRVAGLRRHARLLGGLVLWQAASGVSNVLFDWPLPIAVAHTGGAAGLVLVLTWAVAESRREVGALRAAPARTRERSA